MIRVDIKSVVERIFITFDFTSELIAGETLSGTPTVTASVYLGNDATPAAVLDGFPQKDSTNMIVTQAVLGGVAVTDYKIEASCITSSGRDLSRIAILPVR
jgi:hypothetical protein